MKKPATRMEAITDEQADDATPVCPHCLAEIVPEQYYCDKCGQTVGQLTGVIPFVNIRFWALFVGGIWQRIWFDRRTGFVRRVLLFLLLVLLVPPVILGLPFALWEKLRGRRGAAPGEAPRESDRLDE